MTLPWLALFPLLFTVPIVALEEVCSDQATCEGIPATEALRASAMLQTQSSTAKLDPGEAEKKAAEAKEAADKANNAKAVADAAAIAALQAKDAADQAAAEKAAEEKAEEDAAENTAAMVAEAEDPEEAEEAAEEAEDVPQEVKAAEEAEAVSADQAAAEAEQVDPSALDPGCYLLLPSGCPDQGDSSGDENLWTPDTWGAENLGAADDENACLTDSKNHYNDWCGVEDAETLFIPKTQSLVDTQAPGKVRLHKHSGNHKHHHQ